MVRKLRDRDTFPGAQRPGDEGGPEPEPAPPRPDGYRYERPHIADSAVHRLLAGLGARRFPRSTTLPQTDGHLAAHYDVGPRPAPPPVPTPMLQPSVLVSTTDPGAGPPDPQQRMGETLTIPKHRRPWAAVATVLVVAMCATTAVLEVSQGHATRRAPAATVSSAHDAPSPLATLSAASSSAGPPIAPSAAAPQAEVSSAAAATLSPRAVPKSAPKPVAPTVAQKRAAKEPEVPRSSETFREE